MSRRDAIILQSAAAWTLFIWVTRIRNILGDETRDTAFKVVHVALAVVSVAFAVGHLAGGVEEPAGRTGPGRHVVVGVRLVGTIASAGFASGDRFVVGHWRSGPLGPMDDLMWATADGERWLVAPTQAVADFVSSVYDFDRVVVSPLVVRGGRPAASTSTPPTWGSTSTWRRAGAGRIPAPPPPAPVAHPVRRGPDRPPPAGRRGLRGESDRRAGVVPGVPVPAVDGGPGDPCTAPTSARSAPSTRRCGSGSASRPAARRWWR